MSEMILSVEALPHKLMEMIPTKLVKLRQFDGQISLVPLGDASHEECPLLGIASESKLTVEMFLAMTREDKILEELSP